MWVFYVTFFLSIAGIIALVWLKAMWSGDFFEVLKMDHPDLWSGMGKPGLFGRQTTFNDWPANGFRRWLFIVDARYRDFGDNYLTSLGNRLRIIYFAQMALSLMAIPVITYIAYLNR